jgi:glyoxylase-like metal-dependent hydrolase (beta-lactamase superfamily II)
MVEEIINNIYKIEIPLPNNPLKTVNSYLVKGPKKNLIIDTGLNQKECMNTMQASLLELGVDLKRTDFFITHFHPDHLGLVSKLAKDTSVIYFNGPEADLIRSGIHWDHLSDFARLNGFPEEELRSAIRKDRGFEFASNWQPSFRILREGDTISIGDNVFKCIETPGHSIGHICLYESNKRVFMSGDHILGDISPGIQLWHDEWDPLKEYLASLEKVWGLDIGLVLPGHRNVFRGFKERIEELKNHHQKRLDEIISILEIGKKNAFQIGSLMSWDIIFDSWDLFPALQKMFVLGETIAHLKYLEGKGKIQKEMHQRRVVYSLN